MLLPLASCSSSAAGVVARRLRGVAHLPGVWRSRQLDQRLRDVSTPDRRRAATMSTVVKQASERAAAGARSALARRRALGIWLARLIEQSGSEDDAERASCVMTLVAAAGLAFVAARCSCRAASRCWLRRARRHRCRSGGWCTAGPARLKKFEEQFPEALDLLSRAIRAGHAFQTAMGMIADEVAQPVGPEFKKTFDEQNFGLPLRDALNQLPSACRSSTCASS